MKNLTRFDEFAKGKPTKTKNDNTCVIYTRVSTKEQAEKNMSLDTQRKACEHYARQHNYKIMAYFGGTYESARTDERIEFNNMLSFVRKSREKISFIVVFSVDRFSRSGANAIYITEQLKHQGINLISVMQPTDITTPSGALQQNIQFIFSEYDNQLRREKTISGIRNKLLNGEWCMNAPKGYDVITRNGKRSIVINEEGQLIRKAFLWVLEEKATQCAVVDRLTALGVKISRNGISRLLRNPFYCGILSSRSLQGKVVNGKHEKLVSHQVFLEVNNILNRKTRETEHNGEHDHELPLKVMMKCSECGNSMTGYFAKPKRLYYYKCVKNGCCNNVSQRKVHALLKELLNKIELDRANYPNVEKELMSKFVRVEKLNRSNLQSYKGTLANIELKITNLEERFISREISEDLYSKHLKRLAVQKTTIEIEIDKAKAGVIIKQNIRKRSADILKDFARVWHFGDLSTKRVVQNTLFPEGLLYDKLKKELRAKIVAPGFFLSHGHTHGHSVHE